MADPDNSHEKVIHYGNRIVQVRVKNEHYLEALKSCIDSGFTITDMINEFLMLIATGTDIGKKIVQNMAKKRQNELLKKFNIDPNLQTRLPLGTAVGSVDAPKTFASKRKIAKFVKKQTATGNFDTKTLYDLIGDNDDNDDSIFESSNAEDDR